MFNHILKAVKGIFSRREQAKDTKKKLEVQRKKVTYRSPENPVLFKRKNPFTIKHGRKEGENEENTRLDVGDFDWFCNHVFYHWFNMVYAPLDSLEVRFTPSKGEGND